MMKPCKIFECSCADGFTGDFCEFKTEQDHLLFVHENDALIFNADGRLFQTPRFSGFKPGKKLEFSKFYEPEMGRELKFLLILGFFGISIFGHFRPARMVGVE